ncbi:hypothetical protein HGA92_05020 [Candidatus Gracilibacteria bacterium]|nr:hypothetical protein [Candidatus Gracilibacteria bacterium]NUJ98406.1 hypothetical protein [Candidatus Gracilibacteria bacterium]
MYLLDGNSSAGNILKDIGSLRTFPHEVERGIFVKSINLSILEALNTSTQEAELGLFQFGDDFRSSISSRQKVKYCLNNGIKVFFRHLSNDEDDVEQGLSCIDNIAKQGGKIIVQLPVDNDKIKKRIQGFSGVEDIDNLKGDIDRYGCTQSAIIGLCNYIINNSNINNVVVVGHKGFVGKGVYEGLQKIFPNIKVFGLDKKESTYKEEEYEIISQADLIVSTASEIINLPRILKSGVSIVDCGLIRGEKGIKGSVNIDIFSTKCNFITPVPGGLGPLEMVYLVSKVKNITLAKMNDLLIKNIAFNKEKV